MCWANNGVFPHKPVVVDEEEKENKSLSNIDIKPEPSTQTTQSFANNTKKKDEIEQLYGILLNSIV